MAAKKCPHCGLFNPGEAIRCDCGYDFTTARPPAGPPPADPILVAVLLGTFAAWLPAYLVLVRPTINAVIFKLLPAFPAALHLFPIIGVPILVVAGAAKFRGNKSPDSKS